MNGYPALTDARIGRALAPAPDAAAPAGLLRDALEAASRTRQRRCLLRLPWGSDAGIGFRLTPSPTLAWLAAALVILGLLGSALVAGQRPKEEGPGLAPVPSAGTSGMRLFAMSWDEAYAVAGDDLNLLWHFSDGRWQGPETLGGAIGSIAVLPGGRVAAATSNGLFVRGTAGWSATPLTGATDGIAAALDGSLWAVRSDENSLFQLRLVDGSWREARTVSCPSGGSFLALTSEGAIWTGGFGYTGTGGLARYDGETCSAMSLPGGSALPDVMALAAGPSGELAVAAFDPPYMNGSSRAVLVVYDGAKRSTLKVVDLDGWDGYVGFDRTGDLWVGRMPTGLVRWHRADGNWVEAPAVEPVGGTGYYDQTSLAGDGTLWYVDVSGTIRRARL